MSKASAKQSSQTSQVRAWKAALLKDSRPPCPKKIILRIRPMHSIVLDSGIECNATLHYTEKCAIITLEHCQDYRRMVEDLLHEWGHLMCYPSLSEDAAFDLAHGALRRKYLYPDEDSE